MSRIRAGRVAQVDYLDRGRRNLNPEGVPLLSLLAEDLRTHDRSIGEVGLWALATHRVGNWTHGLPRPLRLGLRPGIRGLAKLVEVTSGISLPLTTRVGRRVRLWHHGGMVLEASAIGDDVHIRHNTTFGIRERDQVGAIPVIEAGADLGTGVSVLGAVRVGRDARVGAHAVVLDDVPDGATAVGVPARVVRRAEASRPADREVPSDRDPSVPRRVGSG